MVVVLARNANNIRATVTFLERRGIAVKLASSLNEAIELFSRKEANMLLLSVNFPHPKVEILPALLAQSFQIETILYAEDSERRTLSRLNSAKSKHVLFGPVSGPVVLMKVRQIEREIAGAGDEQAKGSGQRKTGQYSENDSINVSGARLKSESARKSRLDALKKALAEIESSADGESSGDQKSAGKTFVQKGERAKFMSEVSSGPAALEGSLSERATSLRHGLDLGLVLPLPSAKSKKTLLIMPNIFSGTLTSELADLAPAQWAEERAARLAQRTLEREAELHAGRERAEGVAAEAAAFQQRTDERTRERELTNDELKERLELEKLEAAAAAAKSSIKSESPDEQDGISTANEFSKKPSDVQIIQRCLREALAIVAGHPNPLQAELSNYATATLVSLRTLNLSCSFLVSVAFAKQAASEVFHRMEIAFFSLLRDHGVEFENDQVHSILLDNMSIVEKAFRGSEYVLISQSNDLQIGVASVIAKNPVATFEPYEENMLSVNVHDLPVDEPVTFNVFLHLKRNQRYVRYLKVGARISAPQISRLSSHHPNVLLEENELEAYRRHYAAHSIQGPKRGAA